MWLLAGLVGQICAVTLALLRPLAHGPPLLAALIAIGSGTTLMILCAPWRHLLAWRAGRDRLARLAERLERAERGEAAPPDREPSPSDDELLERLGEAVENVAGQITSDRRDVQRLRRRMGESIRRETHRQTIRLKREALTDPLTGLANRRGLTQRFRELAEAGPGLVVAMAVDLDHFKPINDTLGHDTGDACLRFLGDLLQSSVRREDSPVRLGGDEFLVLMPGQTLGGARSVAERLCDLFRQMPWPYETVPRPGLSVGLASSSFDELGDGRTLLRRADEALYEAKRRGRGRVCAYGEDVGRVLSLES